MIEELKILQEIFGQVAGVSIWAIAAYFVYKLIYVGTNIVCLWLIIKAFKFWVELRHSGRDEIIAAQYSVSDGGAIKF